VTMDPDSDQSGHTPVPVEAADGNSAATHESSTEPSKQNERDVGTDQPGTSGSEGAPDQLTVCVPAAFDLGWTMAGLASLTVSDVDIGDIQRLLPTEYELGRVRRAGVEATRLGCLTATLTAQCLSSQERMPANEIVALQGDLKEEAPTWSKIKDDLITVHMKFLEAFACAGRPLLLAYQLGRSVRDTVLSPATARTSELNAKGMPKTIRALQDEFNKSRITTLQEWLATLAPHFPANGAGAVKTSLGRWSEWVSASFDDSAPGALRQGQTKDSLANKGAPMLLRQGDTWLSILVGTQNLNGVLTPEAYLAAGESALSRSARIIRRVVFHYWLALVILVLAAAGLTALSAEYLGGAGRVWTDIAVVGGALGITAKGIASRIGTLAEAGEKPIYQAAELDAIAWAITTLPDTRLNSEGVHILRKSGIRPSAPLGRA
jgi:hypothetical protein